MNNNPIPIPSRPINNGCGTGKKKPKIVGWVTQSAIKPGFGPSIWPEV
jgi:hypothetical protein